MSKLFYAIIAIASGYGLYWWYNRLHSLIQDFIYGRGGFYGMISPLIAFIFIAMLLILLGKSVKEMFK